MLQFGFWSIYTSEISGAHVPDHRTAMAEPPRGGTDRLLTIEADSPDDEASAIRGEIQK